MEPAVSNLGQLVDSSKHLARRLFKIGENRLQILMVEVQEEREHLLHAIFLALGVAIFGLLAMLALNVAIVVLLWNYSPLAVLLALTCLYAIGAGFLYQRLHRLMRDWKTLSTTLDQLRKDRECLEYLPG